MELEVTFGYLGSPHRVHLTFGLSSTHYFCRIYIPMYNTPVILLYKYTNESSPHTVEAFVRDFPEVLLVYGKKCVVASEYQERARERRQVPETLRAD